MLLGAMLGVACSESSKSNGDADAAGSSGTASGGSSGMATGGSSGGSSGATGASVEYFHPGTRLKPMVLSAAPDLDIIEGTGESGWYDIELDMPCYFIRDENGVVRCFPLSLKTHLTYSDASCTQPVHRTGPIVACGRENLRYVAVEQYGADRCGHRGFRMTDQLPLATPLFSTNPSTLACEPYQATGGTDDILWRLEPVPPETFVAMHEVNRARHPDMDAVVREGDDGSWQVLGFFDKQRGAPCMDFTPLVTPYYKASLPSKRSTAATATPRAKRE